MTTTVSVSQATVREAVERVRPAIETHAEHAERERNLPAPVVDAMRDAGLFDLLLPKEYGGAEVDLPVYLEAVEALSRIDSAAGWVYMILAGSAFEVAFLPPSAVSTIHPHGALTGSAIMPRGRAVPVEGGYRLSGRWPLASGCKHASWLAGNSLIFDGDHPVMSPEGMPQFTLMYVPAEQCTIIDTWDSTGMRGTGSHDFAVEDVFVPEDRTFEVFGAKSYVSGPLYRMRVEMLAITSIVTVSLGIARSAIDTLVAIAKEKTPTLSQTVLAARPTLHAEVAHAEARLQSARAYLFEVAHEMMDAVTTGDEVTPDVEARRRLACANLAESCEEVVDRMYRLSGSTSVYSGRGLDRHLRDIHTVNQHLAASPVWWEKTGQYYFGYGLGMP